MVVEHQQHAGERQHDEEVECDAAHAPGVLIAHRVAIDFRRMKMQKDIRENRQRTIARIGPFVRDAKDRFPNLRLLRVFVFLRFFERAVLQRDGRIFRARH